MISARKPGIRIVTLASVLLASGTAKGDQPVATQESPSEWGLVALEFLGGSAAAVTTIVGAFQIGEVLNVAPTTRDGIMVAALVALPAVEGLIACAIGKVSKHYQGRCFWPMAGAYLAAAPFVPIALLASANQPDAIGQGIAAAFFLGVGVVIAAPAGATVAWNLSKEQRRPFVGPDRRGAAGGLPPALGIPLVATRF